jgi:hypothetical protein
MVLKMDGILEKSWEVEVTTEKNRCYLLSFCQPSDGTIPDDRELLNLLFLCPGQDGLRVREFFAIFDSISQRLNPFILQLFNLSHDY